MSDVIITHNQAQQIAEFIYQNLERYIRENQEKFLIFFEENGRNEKWEKLKY